ncbi:hypothetical protein ACXET9_01940 [Brachybacterium sp. DNPG3]
MSRRRATAAPASSPTGGPASNPTGGFTAARAIWDERDGARTAALDSAYDLYVAVMVLLVGVAPLIRGAALALARPAPLAALLSPAAATTGLALVCAAGAVLVLLGARRGPALLPPFLVVTLASGPAPRRLALRRPFLRSVLLLAGLVLVIALPIGSALALSGAATAGQVVLAGVGALGLGALLAQCWLAGELLEPGARTAVAGALTLLAVLLGLIGPFGSMIGGAFGGGPGSRLGSALTGALAGPTVPILVLVLGALATAAGIRALDRARGSVLRAQSQRWDRTTAIARSADLAGAVGEMRDLPGRGRTLRALGGGPLAWVYLRRDAIAWLRTPQRALLGAVLVLAGSLIVGLATGGGAWAGTGAAAGVATGVGAGSGTGSGLGGVVALLLGGTALLWWGTGAFVDGIRHAIHTLGAPVLFGQSAGRQALLHSLAPTLLLGLLTATTIVVAGMAPLAPLLVPILVVGRIRDAAKGPMPLALMTPMPTVQGDFSALMILGWQADALLITLVAALAVGIAGALHGAAGAAIAALVVLAILAAMAARRIRRLTG